SVDLATKSDAELIDLQLHANDWYVRQARRLLQERSAHSRDKGNQSGTAAVREALRRIAFEHQDETRRLRGLWALHVTGGLREQDVLRGLADTGPYIRAWTIQLALEQGSPSPAIANRLAELARTDPSPTVRLYFASGLQRLPPAQRLSILDGLIA